MMDYLHSKQTKEDMGVGLDRKTHRFREVTMARKRNREYHKQLFWNNIKNYYKIWELQANKYNLWASQLHLHSSSTEGRLELQKHKLEDLLKRRTKLATLLAEEQKLMDKELKAEEKLCQNLVEKCLIEEIREKSTKELMLETAKDKKQQLILETEQEMKLANLRKLENDLLILMQDVKNKDKLSLELECLELHEIKLKNELEKLSFARNQKELGRKKKEFYSPSLRHQYQLQLRKRSKEIQARLEEDRLLINEISKCFEREEIKNSYIQEQARKEIEKANTVLAGHTHLEEERKRETSFMFFEEARSMLQKREACWDTEQETRDAVIRDVLVTIQNEVNKKLQYNAEKHKKLANEKEEILKNIEDLNKKMRNYKIPSL